MAKKVEILLYDGINESEFGILYELLATAEIDGPGGPPRARGFTVDTVADRISAVQTANGVKISPDKGLAGSIGADILVIPGGPGARKPNIAQGILDWMTRAVGSSELIASSSTGVYIIGRAGLINNRRVTTHNSLLEDLKRLYPRANVVDEGRTVSDGKNLLTSAGGSSAIDLALEIIFRSYGAETAQRAANRIEFVYTPPVVKKSSFSIPDLNKPDW